LLAYNFLDSMTNYWTEHCPTCNVQLEGAMTHKNVRSFSDLTLTFSCYGSSDYDECHVTAFRPINGAHGCRDFDWYITSNRHTCCIKTWKLTKLSFRKKNRQVKNIGTRVVRV